MVSDKSPEIMWFKADLEVVTCDVTMTAAGRTIPDEGEQGSLFGPADEARRYMLAYAQEIRGLRLLQTVGIVDVTGTIERAALSPVDSERAAQLALTGINLGVAGVQIDVVRQ